MYIRKSVGPRTDPWGTPDVTLSSLSRTVSLFDYTYSYTKSYSV